MIFIDPTLATEMDERTFSVPEASSWLSCFSDDSISVAASADMAASKSFSFLSSLFSLAFSSLSPPKVEPLPGRQFELTKCEK